MSTDRDFARRIYESFLDERFLDEELEEIAGVLDLEEREGEPRDQAIARIVGHIDQPGALETYFKSRSKGAFSLLREVLAVGDVHPRESLQEGLYGERPEDTSELFSLLQRLGLFSIEVVWDETLLRIQPWVRHLIDPPSIEDGNSRMATPEREDEVRLPLPQILVLAANFLRSERVRVTTQATLYKRDLSRARKLFKAASDRTRTPVFELAMKLLERVGCVRRNHDLDLEISGSEVERVLLKGQRELAVEILAENEPDTSLVLFLLDALDRADNSGRALGLPRLIVHGELFLLASRRQNAHPAPDRIRRALDELTLFSLIEKTSPREESVAYSINPFGRALLEELRSKDTGKAPPGDPETENERWLATVQPNLDVHIPLDAPAEIHWELGTVARLVSVDSMCHYAIEKRHAQRTFCHEDRNLENYLETLEKSTAHGVPENVQQTLRSWLGKIAQVELARGWILTVDEEDDDAARAAITEAGEKLDARRIATGIYLVDEHTALERIRLRLHEAGLRVTTAPDSHTEGTDWSASHGASRRDVSDAFGELRHRVRELDRVCEEIDAQLVIRPADPAGDPDTVPRTDFEITGNWIDSASGDVSNVIHQAVRGGDALDMVVDGHGDESDWRFVPRTVHKRGSRVYVTGFCPGREEHRVFPLDEILRVRIVSLKP